MIGASSRALLGAAGASGGSTFNPETDITWDSLYWAEGTNFVAEGYSDTDTVTTWPNETSEQDLDTAVGTASTYDADNATLNNQPAVNLGEQGLEASSITSSVTWPISMVWIGYQTTGDYNARSFARFGSAAWEARGDSTGRMRIANDAVYYTGGAYNPNNKSYANAAGLYVGVWDGATTELWYNGNDGGTGDLSAGNAWSSSVFSVTLNRPSGGYAVSQVCSFWGIYDGDVTADSSWSDFETWVSDHYGITIA